MKYSDPPRILVTTSRGDGAEEYLDTLREAGADPVLVDAGSETPSLSDVDGLLVTGGVDVDPALYGAAASPLVGRVERERDDFESVLLRDARERRLPTFCICRGLQIANVAFGGTLITDVPTALENNAKIITALKDDANIRHAVRAAAGRSERGVIPEHVVRIEPGSLLARTVRTLDLPTGARHHQAVERCAGDLRVVGRTDDGIVEALEARFDSPFWLAVQWHPESTRDVDGGASRKLFEMFVWATKSERTRRAPYDANRFPTAVQWFAGLSDTERLRAQTLIARLERLGDDDPLSTARSEMEENIPQTARWMAVRPLWDIIDGWRKPTALAEYIHEARIDPGSAFADAWLAADRMAKAGIPFEDVAAFARGVSYATVFRTLLHLNGATWPDDWPEDDDLPTWAFMEIQNDELTGRLVDGLYEDLLGTDPSGREGRSPKESG